MHSSPKRRSSAGAASSERAQASEGPVKEDLMAMLPEFPVETFASIGPLEPSDRGPFLTLRPSRVEVQPKERAAAAMGPSRSSHATREYGLWVTYPRVVCHPPGELVEGLEISALSRGAASPGDATDDFAQIATRERHYRLSSLEGRRFPDPLWCTVTYGPRLAFATETESCIEGDEPRWELYLADSPGVGAVWHGTEADMPTVPSLTVYWGTKGLLKQGSECCPGFFWCKTTGSCIPTGVHCQDAIII